MWQGLVLNVKTIAPHASFKSGKARCTCISHASPCTARKCMHSPFSGRNASDLQHLQSDNFSAIVCVCGKVGAAILPRTHALTHRGVTNRIKAETGINIKIPDFSIIDAMSRYASYKGLETHFYNWPWMDLWPQSRRCNVIAAYWQGRKVKYAISSSCKKTFIKIILAVFSSKIR